MAELSSIGFKPGNSPLHQLDPRTKQLLLMVLSIAALYGNPLFLTVSSILMIVLFRLARLQLVRFLVEIRYFLLFLLLLFIVQTVGFNEQWPPTITVAGTTAALIMCWRFLLLVFMSVLLMSTTRTADIRAALIWALKPLPLVNEQMAATMVGLVVRLLPLILFQAGDIGDAMRARGIDGRKKPITRLTIFTIALFRRVFLRADELVDTMQARCYNEQRTMPQLSFCSKDLLAAAVVGVLLLIPIIV